MTTQYLFIIGLIALFTGMFFNIGQAIGEIIAHYIKQAYINYQVQKQQAKKG